MSYIWHYNNTPTSENKTIWNVCFWVEIQHDGFLSSHLLAPVPCRVVMLLSKCCLWSQRVWHDTDSVCVRRWRVLTWLIDHVVMWVCDGQLSTNDRCLCAALGVRYVRLTRLDALVSNTCRHSSSVVIYRTDLGRWRQPLHATVRDALDGVSLCIKPIIDIVILECRDDRASLTCRISSAHIITELVHTTSLCWRALTARWSRLSARSTTSLAESVHAQSTPRISRPHTATSTSSVWTDASRVVWWRVAACETSSFWRGWSTTSSCQCVTDKERTNDYNCLQMMGVGALRSSRWCLDYGYVTLEVFLHGCPSLCHGLGFTTPQQSTTIKLNSRVCFPSCFLSFYFLTTSLTCRMSYRNVAISSAGP